MGLSSFGVSLGAGLLGQFVEQAVAVHFSLTLGAFGTGGEFEFIHLNIGSCFGFILSFGIHEAISGTWLYTPRTKRALILQQKVLLNCCRSYLRRVSVVPLVCLHSQCIFNFFKRLLVMADYIICDFFCLL